MSLLATRVPLANPRSQRSKTPPAQKAKAWKRGPPGDDAGRHTVLSIFVHLKCFLKNSS